MTAGNSGDSTVAWDELSGRVAALEGEVRDIAQSVIGLAEVVEAAMARPADAASRSAQPAGSDDAETDGARLAWSDRASVDDWRELTAWVDWLRGTYDVVPDRRIPACWPDHRGLANELAALHSAWRDALRAEDEDGDANAVIHWHDRWLAPMLHRAGTLYGARICRDESHDAQMLPPPTNWSLVSVGEHRTAADG